MRLRPTSDPSTTRNPFVDPSPTSERPEQAESDLLFGDRLSIPGPSVPPGVAATATPTMKLTVRAGDPLLWVTGLHGGAGASTVLQLLGDDCQVSGTSWPWPVRDGPRYSRVLLVARTHAVGLQFARWAAAQWATGSLSYVNLVGLILVADGPRPSKALRDELLQVAHLTPQCWHLPWQESWRSQLTVDLSSAPLRVRRLITDIRSRAAAARDAPNLEERHR